MLQHTDSPTGTSGTAVPRQWGGPPIIDISEIQVISKIGSGCFGNVFRGVCRSVEVAVKVPTKQSFDPKQLAAFQHEVQIMSKIFHPNVCLFMGACLTPGKVRIVTELMKGDLEALLLDHSRELSLSTRIKMAKDAAQGMAWLHGHVPPVYHRDLKAANLLYDDALKIKVCDFGLSETKPSGRELYDRQPKGTPLYMAPEVMKQKKITEKVDVYSFGIVLWEIYARKEAYTEFEDYESFFNNVVKQHYRPPLPPDALPALAELITQCWHHKPLLRPAFAEIVPKLEAIRLDVIQRENEAVVESQLHDPLVCDMWKREFLHESSVSWAQFSKAFYALLGIPLPLPPDERPLPADASMEQLQAATLAQLEQYAGLHEDNRELVEEEKARRRALPCSSVVVPEGYENNTPVSAAATPSSSTITTSSSPLSDSVSPNSYTQGGAVVPHDLESCKFYCLKALVANEQEQIDLGCLDKTLGCFGPVATPGILDRIHALMKEPYFFGFLPTSDADNLLRVLKVGTYLLRFSNNRPNSFCISKVSSGNTIRHVIITRKDDGWTLDGKSFPTVSELIIQNKERYKLDTPCLGSRFTWLFEQSIASLSGYGHSGYL